MVDDSRFSQMHNIDNNGKIAIWVFPHICSFLLYSNGIVIVNSKFDITGYKSNTFQDWILWWSSKFQMAQLKHKNVNIAILVLWRVCENLDWLQVSEVKGQSFIQSQLSNEITRNRQLLVLSYLWPRLLFFIWCQPILFADSYFDSKK